MLLSIIIPVYNEKSTVEEVINKVLGINLPCEKEIIVVDDGSNDGTAEVLRLQETKITRLYSNPVNVGKGAAVRIGLSFVRGDIILIQDADLELDPNEYAQLLQPIFERKTSVVYGSRFLERRPKISPLRRFANFFLTELTNVLYGSKLTDMGTAYKVFTSEVAKKLNLRANKFEIDPEITAQICRLGYKIIEIPISYNPRTVLEGKKIRAKDGVKAVWTLFHWRFEKLKK